MYKTWCHTCREKLRLELEEKYDLKKKNDEEKKEEENRKRKRKETF